MRTSPLFWLLGVHLYDFDVGYFRNAELVGKALIVSTQLWSLIREDRVISILIGPGIFRGVATSGNRRADILELIPALMFDPTHLRPDEPVPLVDIVNPEVIDPLAASRQEEIMTFIRKLVVEKGNVLSGDTILRLRQDAAVPTTAHALDLVKRINVRHVSGVQRAKFVLAGTNGPMYKPFVQAYEKKKFEQPERIKVMATPFGKFTSLADIEVMSNWTIVEKAGFDSKTGIESMQEEYEWTLRDLAKNEASFIYEV
jgi:hypothetical protein